MQARPSRWECAPYEVEVARRLAHGLGVSPPVGTVLARRGFSEPGEARRFLAAEERHDPRVLSGVTEASALILEHVRRGTRIAVFGDYDVDGVCSTAMLVRTLRALGADPAWMLPSRFDEGYGLSRAAVERLARRGTGLLVTVDCGVTAVEQVAAARAAGLDVVVTDHHRPGPVLPDCPLVHPAPPDAEAYPAVLCAAGVVLKLSQALRDAAGHDPGSAEEDLDLAALATVCDLVPLHDENRRIVREGLRELARSEKPGLRSLMAVAGVEPGDVSEHSLGFRLGPRINAAGRMGRADAALELLLTEAGARADEIARELDLLNRDRQEAETRILFAADAACAPQASRAALVVAGSGWHPGVVGIVASRLVEKWRRPAVVVALDDDGASRGSGRSISAYDLHAGLSACSVHLRRFGGHPMAAGVELEAGAVDGFRDALAAHAGAALAPADLIPVERVDAVVPGGELGLELAEELELLRPFGMGNPQPTLLVPAARIENVAGMGEERQHARFTLVSGGARARGVAFGATQKSLATGAGEARHVAVRLESNRWNGAVAPRVLLRALCTPEPGSLRELGETEPFWERVSAELGRDPAGSGAPAPEAAGSVTDRRGAGFAGIAGDLLSSGESVLVAVADLPRRRASLEALVASMAGSEGLAVISWTALALDPAAAAGFRHLVALDPPPGGMTDPLLRIAPSGHAGWGPDEAAFALAVWCAELELRPALTDTFRALRALASGTPAAALESALRGEAAYPRSPGCCGRVLRILSELGLVEMDLGELRCTVVQGVRSDLELSPAYRAYRARFAEIERALDGELPAAPRALPVARAS
jgi:single-stranded-DNA-specific exonuclease